METVHSKSNRQGAKRCVPEAWNRCPGKLNPADIPIRGLGATDLKDNETWWYELEFLQQTPDNWPERPNAHMLDDDQVQDE